jgi:hypothetical protein
MAVKPASRNQSLAGDLSNSSRSREKAFARSRLRRFVAADHKRTMRSVRIVTHRKAAFPRWLVASAIVCEVSWGKQNPECKTTLISDLSSSTGTLRASVRFAQQKEGRKVSPQNLPLWFWVPLCFPTPALNNWSSCHPARQASGRPSSGCLRYRCQRWRPPSRSLCSVAR